MGVGMAEKIKDNKMVLLLLISGAVYFFLKVLAPLTAPVLAAILFVTIFGPLLQRMQRRLKVHRQIGALFLLLLGCCFLAVLIWVLFSWIVGSLPGLVRRLDLLETDLALFVHELCNVVGKALGKGYGISLRLSWEGNLPTADWSGMTI